MQATIRWLLTTGRFAATPAALLSGLAKHLCEAGFELLRLNVQPRTLHAAIMWKLYLWRPRAAPSEIRPGTRVLESESCDAEYGVVQESSLGYGTNTSDAFRS